MDQKKALMLENLSEMRQAITREGELEKEINEVKKKRKEKFRQACICATYYYTPEMIDKIYNESISVLKVKDFDPELYKEKFSDIETISESDILFLNDKEDEIRETKKTLDSLNNPPKESIPLINFTNAVLGRKK